MSADTFQNETASSRPPPSVLVGDSRVAARARFDQLMVRALSDVDELATFKRLSLFGGYEKVVEYREEQIALGAVFEISRSIVFNVEQILRVAKTFVNQHADQKGTREYHEVRTVCSLLTPAYPFLLL